MIEVKITSYICSMFQIGNTIVSEDILKRIEDVIQNASEKLDICISHHILEDSSHKNHLLKALLI